MPSTKAYLRAVPILAIIACLSIAAFSLPSSDIDDQVPSIPTSLALDSLEKKPVRIHDGYPRLANTLGWMSIMAWILVSADQILLCFKQKSGDGLSLVFLIIWLVGDLTNLLGSLWQGLIPTVIILAVYYTACDCILIFQKYYYHSLRVRHPELYGGPLPSQNSTSPPLPTPLSENTPLLSAFSAHSPSEKAFSPAIQRAKDILEYTLGFVLVCVVGVVAWFVGKGVGKEGRVVEVWDTSAQVVGWISAFLYLGSRLPQLALNRKTKCEGLSLLMFCFAVIGNFTFVASILLTSMSAQHLLVNAPWLLGSGGTIFLDFLVLGQFTYYAKERRERDERERLFVDEEEEVRRSEVLGDGDDRA